MYGGYSLAVEQRVVVPLVRVQLPLATQKKTTAFGRCFLHHFLAIIGFLPYN